MVDRLSRTLRTYARAVLLQSVGLIGLAWCFAESQAGFAIVLTILVLIDQTIFIRARATDPSARGVKWLDVWCVSLGVLDILLCFAAIVRGAGLRDGTDGAVTTDLLDCLAYVLAAFVHGPTSLSPATAAGRLAGAVLAVLGILAFLAAVAAILQLRRAPEGPDRSR